MKKRTLRLFAAALALCVAVTPLPAPTLAAETGTVHTVAELGNVYTLLNSGAVADGDIIRLEGNGWVRTNDEAPWVPEKNVTIEGGTLQLDVSGVVLGADVTFRNVALSFNKPARNAIVANGHALTLDSVTCANHSFNLFGGGLVNSNNEAFTLPAPGGRGVITVLGKTSLQNRDEYGKGNVYAGNLSMGGMTAENNGADANAPANVFTGDVLIDIQGNIDTGALGKVYACGAQQRIPVGAQSGKVTLPDAEAYTVSGAVTVQGALPDMEGAGAAETRAVYRDVSGNNYLTTRTLLDVSSLAVESGYFCLEPETRLRGGKGLSLSAGAKLSLTKLAGLVNLEVDSFQGGGILVLDLNQTWRVAGEVTGKTRLAVGGTNADHTASMTLPLAGHVYLQAPGSAADSFVLLPNSAAPAMTLTRDDSGSWMASAGTPGEDEGKIASFGFAVKTAAADPGQEAALEMEAALADGSVAWLDELPLTVTVNQSTTLRRDENDYIYRDTLGEFSAEVSENVIYITTSKAGTYTIEVTLPTGETVDGAVLSDTATLTVGGGAETPDPEPTVTPTPTPTPTPDPSPSPEPDPTPSPSPEPSPSPDPSPSPEPSPSPSPEPSPDPSPSPSPDPSPSPSPDPEPSPSPSPSPSPGPGPSETPGGGGGGGGASGGGGSSSTPPPAEPAKPTEPETTAVPASEKFTDVVKGSWYEAGVTFVTDKGLFQGMGEGIFAPGETMTRAMLVTVLARLDEQETEGGETWYAKAMDWAKERGISDGTLPGDDVTREQLAVMLYRYAKPKRTAGDLSVFSDRGEVSGWAVEAMTWAAGSGIVTGKQNARLDPQGAATRAEVAVMLERFIALIGK